MEVLRKKNNKERSIRVLLTAGPTRAYLDEVRYLTNYSTGELGFNLCRTLKKNGIEVAAVVGPTNQPFSKLKLKQLVEVETANQMFDAILKLCQTFRPDFAIFSAAVLDFEPQKKEPKKVSSSRDRWVVEFVPTRKIIDQVGISYPSIKRIGFKLEWDLKKGKDLSNFAQKLLDKKNYHAVCINFLSQIRRRNHPMWILTRDGKIKKVNTKQQIAREITNLVKQQDARTC